MSSGDHIHIWREFKRVTFTDGDDVYSACKVCVTVCVDTPEMRRAKADKATE